jgi:hypothetical protein
MVEEPTCPYCRTPFNESIPVSLEGPILIRCPQCDFIFVFMPQLGAFPIEDDIGLHISQGHLGSRVSIGTPVDSFEGSNDTLSRAFFCTCSIIISAFIIATAMFILLNSSHKR